MVDTAHAQQDMDGYPVFNHHWSTKVVVGLLAGITVVMALLLGTAWWLCYLNCRLDGTEEELESFMSGADKFLEDLFGEANGHDSLARQHRKVIKARIKEAEIRSRSSN